MRFVLSISFLYEISLNYHISFQFKDSNLFCFCFFAQGAKTQSEAGIYFAQVGDVGRYWAVEMTVHGEKLVEAKFEKYFGYEARCEENFGI